MLRKRVERASIVSRMLLRSRVRRTAGELGFPDVSLRWIWSVLLFGWGACLVIAILTGVMVSIARDAAWRDYVVGGALLLCVLHPLFASDLGYARVVAFLGEPLSRVVRRTSAGREGVLLGTILFPTLISTLAFQAQLAAFASVAAAPSFLGAVVMWWVLMTAGTLVILVRYGALLVATKVWEVDRGRVADVYLVLASGAVECAAAFYLVQVLGRAHIVTPWLSRRAVQLEPWQLVVVLVTVSLLGLVFGRLVLLADLREPTARIGADVKTQGDDLRGDGGRRSLLLWQMRQRMRRLERQDRIRVLRESSFVLMGISAMWSVVTLLPAERGQGMIGATSILVVSSVVLAVEGLSHTTAYFLSPDADGPAAAHVGRNAAAWAEWVKVRLDAYLLLFFVVGTVTFLVSLPVLGGAAKSSVVVGLGVSIVFYVAVGAVEHVYLPARYPRFDWENVHQIGRHPKVVAVGQVVATASAALLTGALVGLVELALPFTSGAPLVTSVLATVALLLSAVRVGLHRLVGTEMTWVR